ncbi:hypothetical protein FJT64_019848 [Amphibalanus amphitrite]|uniref:Uncharacterized protein n=1 Tax=Amphibalanus amphitrite TaxID=1232801 RepID=A0A6A4WYU4_AMPAM|nr:hypothetical protein FJT64_019848 [Amphibalanus amphitrite]
MDFLESSLAAPSVPSDPVAPVRLKRKRGPAPGDRPEPALGRPLLDEQQQQQGEAGRAVSLLDRVRRFAALCLWPADDSDQMLVPSEPSPSLLSRLVGTLRRGARACCEAIINGFIWSAQARPY